MTKTGKKSEQSRSEEAKRGDTVAKKRMKCLVQTVGKGRGLNEERMEIE